MNDIFLYLVYSNQPPKSPIRPVVRPALDPAVSHTAIYEQAHDDPAHEVLERHRHDFDIWLLLPRLLRPARTCQLLMGGN